MSEPEALMLCVPLSRAQLNAVLDHADKLGWSYWWVRDTPRSCWRLHVDGSATGVSHELGTDNFYIDVEVK